MPRRLLALGLAIAAALGVVLAGRIGWVAYGPEAGPGASAAQVRFLHHALDTGGADRMQQFFPEGSFFLRALTAAAATAVPEPDLGRARALRDSLDAPESVAVFGSGMVPEHGIFAAGWSLMVAVEVARDSGAPDDAEGVRRRAVVVEEALRGSQSGFLEGYPGQYWPCDTVVAAASLAAAAVLLDQPDWLATVRAWRDQVPARPAQTARVSACCRIGWMTPAPRWRGRVARRSRSSRPSGRPSARRWARGRISDPGNNSVPLSSCARPAWWASGSIRGHRRQR